MAKNNERQYEMHVTEFEKAVKGFIGKTKYGKGGYCELLTQKLLDKKARQYSEWYHKTKCRTPGYKHLTNYEYLKRFVDKGWFLADCCGLIKGVRAGFRADGTVGRMTTAIDQTIEEMHRELIDKTDCRSVCSGGVICFEDNTHIAMISEMGVSDVESSPSLDGVAEVSINYQPKFKNASGGKLPWVDYTPKKEKIAEDGIWGTKTTRRAQEEFGTTVDGIVSRQLSRMRNRMPGCTSGWQWVGASGDNGSELIRALQKWLRVTVDGHMGPKTIEALQRKMGTPVDGVLSKPSQCIKAFQKYLNER